MQLFQANAQWLGRIELTKVCILFVSKTDFFLNQATMLCIAMVFGLFIGFNRLTVFAFPFKQ